MSSNDEARRKEEKPVCSKETAIKIAKELYGLAVDASCKVKEMESYDDRNFYLKGTIVGCADVKEFTLKVHNGVESDTPIVLEAQNAILTHLSDAGFDVPTPMKTAADELIAYTELPLKHTGKPKRHAVRLLAWVKGKMLADIECDACLLYNAGAWRTRSVLHTHNIDRFLHNIDFDAGVYLGNLSQALDGFDHPGSHRFHQWDLNSTGSLSNFTRHIIDPSRRDLVNGVIQEWEKEVCLKTNRMPNKCPPCVHR